VDHHYCLIGLLGLALVVALFLSCPRGTEVFRAAPSSEVRCRSDSTSSGPSVPVLSPTRKSIPARITCSAASVAAVPGGRKFAVETLVEIGQLVEAFGRDRCRALAQHRLDALDDLPVLAARRKPCILPFQQGPHLDSLARFLLRHGRDRSTAPRSDFDQALGGERPDRLAHGIARDSKLVGEVAFDQTFAWLQSPGQDGLTQLHDHPVVKRGLILAEPTPGYSARERHVVNPSPKSESARLRGSDALMRIKCSLVQRSKQVAYSQVYCNPLLMPPAAIDGLRPSIKGPALGGCYRAGSASCYGTGGSDGAAASTGSGSLRGTDAWRSASGTQDTLTSPLTKVWQAMR
jgi:hypothetical protein